MRARKTAFKFVLAAFVLLVALGRAGAASFDLTGDYLKVGINNSGGLIDSHFYAGIQFDGTGSGTFPASPPAADLLRPGNFEFYAIGINGVDQGAAGYGFGNTYGMKTINTSGGTTLSALSYGTYTSPQGTLLITQNVYFAQNGSSIDFAVTFTNAGREAISDLVYARGLDANPDGYGQGTGSTINWIGQDTVTALGPYSHLAVQIESLVGNGVGSITNWDTNPYTLLAGVNEGNGAYSIAMAWDLGSLAPNTSTVVDFAYNIGDPVPVPPSLLLLSGGLVGLGMVRRRRKGRA